VAVWQLEIDLREFRDGSEKREVGYCVMAVVASLCVAVWQLENDLREFRDGSEKREVGYCVMAVVASLCVVPVRWSH